MWYNIFKFEIQYRIKRPDTYVFFIFLFLFSLVGIEFIFQGADLGSVKANAPIIIATAMAAITGILMIIVSLIMGVPVLRDFEYNIESLLFVNPIKKRDYLLGKFLGSFVILLFVFTGLLLGFALGEFMPWRNPKELMPFNFFSYLQPFVVVVLPMLFFGSALFFVSGTLSRRLMVVYTQGVFIFVPFLLTKSIKNDFFQALLDPFSLTTLTDVNALFTTVAERNTMLLPFDGILLYNKLFWILIGLFVLGVGYYQFNFNVVKSKKPKKKKINLIDALPFATNKDVKIPTVQIHHNFKAHCVQLQKLTWFYFSSITKQISFWAIIIFSIVIVAVNSINLKTMYDVKSYAKTYTIVAELLEMSSIFFIVILVFYSGELIWKERGAKINLIYDATPIPNFISLLGKFISLLGIFTVLILSLILMGITFQITQGYYYFELDVYFYGFFIEWFPYLLLYTIISLFFQVIANNKFVGFILVLVFGILIAASGFLGFENNLYIFGGRGLNSYSDMNGYGHFLAPYLWIKAYWFVFGSIVLVITSILSVRGAEINLKKRLKLSKERLSKPLLKFGVSAIIIFVIIGSYIFYNTNIRNEYQSTANRLEISANYEKTLKKFEYLPQPKITAINLKVELYPKIRNYMVAGFYILTNTQKVAINKIYIQKRIASQVNLESVTFEGGANVNYLYKAYGFYIYTLHKALQPGDAIKMSFKQTFISNGFKEANFNKNILQNGTFLTNKEFPTFGYNKEYELEDEEIRKEYKLSLRKGMAKQNHAKELTFARHGADANLINFEMVIGTDSNQKAITSGSLQREWVIENRSYFQYKTDKPIINKYAITSASYEVIKDTWVPRNDSLGNPVDLEIYYHKGHEYNLDKMMETMKLSFDYFSTNFSPYQHKQMRILEISNTIEYATSFPNTIPFYETKEFILNSNDETDVDIVFYNTARELSHQWWGMYIEAANVQGRNMLLETLAQYSALMVLNQKYSEEKVAQFLQKELEVYLKIKKNVAKEVSLELVENQDYIYNKKGAIAMFELQNKIGEDKVNLALKRFIKDWNSFDLKSKRERYATTKDLLGYFKEVTPDSLQYVIKDLFETVTLYDNNIIKSSSKLLDNGKYQVDIEFQVSKYRIDETGNRKYSDTEDKNQQSNLSLPLADYIEIGIFGEDKEVLYLKKHKITTIANKTTIIVDQKPTEVGVDPYTKLIDANMQDNVKTLLGKN